jgi:conjugal transfer/entry exclusion protein
MCDEPDRLTDPADKMWNSRKAAVTADVLKEYKELVVNTTTDLEDHLQEIERKLQNLPLRGDTISDEDAAERERMQKEKESTKQCLAICEQVFEQVSQVRPNVFEDVSAAQDAHQVDISTLGGLIPAKRVTDKVLEEFQDKLTSTSSDLNANLQKINIRLQGLSSSGTRIVEEDVVERKRLQEEIESIKQCLAICTQASEKADQVRTNVFEDVSAAKDAHQLIISTLGDLILAKRVTAGLGSDQWLGQASDATIQQLSRDRVDIRGRAATDKGVEPQKFADQYGVGYKLG